MTPRKLTKAPITNGQNELDLFNIVGRRTMLSHQNLHHLMRNSFMEDGMTDEQYTELSHNNNLNIAVIPSRPSDESIDDSLLGTIMAFYNKNILVRQPPERQKCSIVLARGYLNRRGDLSEITGCSHWSCLHLRLNAAGNAIEAYHINSSNPEGRGQVPESIQRIITKANTQIRASGIRASGMQILIQQPREQSCIAQNDGFSCGYHAVFNAMNSFNTPINQPIAPPRDDFNRFLQTSRARLMQEFDNERIFTRARSSITKSKKPPTQKTAAVSSPKKGEDYFDRLLQELEQEDSPKKLSTIYQLEQGIRRENRNIDLLSSFELEKVYNQILVNISTQITDSRILEDFDLNPIEIENFVAMMTSKITANNIGKILKPLEDLYKLRRDQDVGNLFQALIEIQTEHLGVESDEEHKKLDPKAKPKPNPAPAPTKSHQLQEIDVVAQFIEKVKTPRNPEELRKTKLAANTELQKIPDKESPLFKRPKSYVGFGVASSHKFNTENNCFEFTITEVFEGSKAQAIGLAEGDIFIIESEDKGNDLAASTTKLRNFGLDNSQTKLTFFRPPEGLSEGEQKELMRKFRSQEQSFIHNQRGVADFKTLKAEIKSETGSASMIR